MKLLIVDDEIIILKDLEHQLKEICPNAEIVCLTTYQDAIKYAQKNYIDIALLDIELGDINGLTLAKELKDMQSEIHIIFVTAYSKYAVDAFTLHATGYLLKPIQKEQLEKELTFVYEHLPETKGIYVRTFGGFDVFVNDQPIIFKRAKAKELLAYLVDRRGMGITTRQACSILWEDEPYDIAMKNYFQVILSDLKKTLQSYGIMDILRRKRNFIAIDPSRIDCDSYRFINGDARAINSYRHDYMICYSWAEFSMGILDEKIKL